MTTRMVEWHQGVPVTLDGFMRQALLPQIFSKSFGYFDHFVCPPLASSTVLCGFITTVLTSGTLTIATGDTAADGWLNMVGSATDGQGIQCQGSEAFLPAAGKDIFFVTRMRIQDADDADWFFGLANHDTNIFSTQPAEIIGFLGDDGDANIDFQMRNGGTGNQADTTYDAANATEVILGFHVEGITRVTPYINGVALTPVTANMPTGAMALTFGMLNGGTTANQIVAMDYLGAFQVS